MIEHVERRVLGALEFVSAATGARVAEPLRISADGLTTRRNASGLVVLWSARGLEPHNDVFLEPPGTPAVESVGFDLDIEDPSRRYLPRRAHIDLPRKAAPETDPDSVLVPIRIELMPAPATPTTGTATVLRVRVAAAATPVPRKGIANAYLRATLALDPPRLATAMTDARGEGVLVVAGVDPVVATPGPSPLGKEFDASVEIVLDSAVARLADSEAIPCPDPEEIERRRAAADPAVTVLPAAVVTLISGGTQTHTFEVSWP